MTTLTHFAKSMLPPRVRRAIRWLAPSSRRPRMAYSQEGEDIALAALLNRIGKTSSGFYVDVGAHHPKQLSNTYFFYRRGWRGINIDAMPGSMILFNRVRPRDINIELGVSREPGEMEFYVFNDSSLNGFSKQISEDRDGLAHFRILRTVPITTLPLADILDRYMDPDQQIDFLSVDVEGLDLDVLESNDWSRHRPTVVLAESLTASLSELSDDAVASFLAQQSYVPAASTGKTILYLREDAYARIPRY